MWFRQLTNYLLTHRITALFIAFFAVSTTVIDVFQSMPLAIIPMIGGTFFITYAALVTLLQGAVLGGVFTIAVTLPYLIKIAYMLQQAQPVPVELSLGIAFACIANILTWVVACMIRRLYSWSTVMQAAALAGVLAVCVIYLVYPDINLWWTQILQKPAAFAQNQAAVTGQPAIPADTQKQMIDTVSRVATGFMVSGVLLIVFMQVIAARWWQGFLYSTDLLRRELFRIRLGSLAGILFVAGLFISGLSAYYSQLNNNLIPDIMPIAYILFLAAGLNLVHYFFSLVTSKAKFFWMVFFYIFFIYMAPFSIVLVALLALFDIWIDFRKRFQPV